MSTLLAAFRNETRATWTVGVLTIAYLITAVVVFPHSVAAQNTHPLRHPLTKDIALTFDDGPNGQSTRDIVDILQAKKVPAMFFEVGRSIAADPDTTQYVSAHGFPVENHTWDHDMHLPQLTAAQVSMEIDATNQIISQVVGQSPEFFRWPHGKHTALDDRVAHSLRAHVVGWSVDPKDYATNDADLIYKRVIGAVHGGDIILLHDGLQDGQYSQVYHNRQGVIDALPRIIDTLRARGFVFRSIPDLLRLPGKHAY